jgi:hypothetical protein
MNIPKQGTNLTDKLRQVENDINSQNGRACQDLKALANQAKAQTGKTITATQASQILGAVAAFKPRSVVARESASRRPAIHRSRPPTRVSGTTGGRERFADRKAVKQC